MIPIILLCFAIVAFAIHYAFDRSKGVAAPFLRYLIFFNIGILGFLAFYAHVFMADETAEKIGWPTGSPFQFEMGLTNLSYGVLGVLCLFTGIMFWLATTIGAGILFLGCFHGHIIQWQQGNTHPYNIGISIWFSDLIIPILYLCLMAYVFFRYRKSYTIYQK